jgi:myosin heavy subunit
VADLFHRQRTTEQLRYGGVLEAVRVARSGFPVRLSHADFYFRYRPLVNPFDDRISKLPRAIPEKATNAKEIVELLLQVLWDCTFDKEQEAEETSPSARKSRRKSKLDEIKTWRGKKDVPKESCQLGLTKVFIRKQAHDVLESWRSRRLVSAARKVQSTFRMCIYRSWFLLATRAVRLLQRIIRGVLARKRVDIMRKTVAATLLQKAYRCHRGYVNYGRFKLAVLALQCYFRRRVASKAVSAVRRSVQAVRLQAVLRGLNDRRRWLKYRRAVVALQCGLRCRIAKKLLKAYRIEAKDVGRLQQSNEALKAEIEALRARAAEEAQRIQAEMIAKLEAAALAAKEEDSKRTQDELEKTRKELEEERVLRMDLQTQLKAALEAKNAAESQLRAQASSPVGLADLEEALQKETASRESLENEVARLRADLLAAQQQLSSISSSSSQVHRRPDENPRRRGSSSRKGRISIDEGTQHGPRTSENWIETWEDESEDSGSDVIGASSTASEAGSAANYRPRASFSERVVPPAYTRSSADHIVSVQQKVAQTKSAMDTFEKNLENFKGRLKEGVRVFVWDRTSARVEAMLKLVDEDILTFTPPVRRFSLFSAKIDIRPINVTDILECQPGADRERAQDLTDDSCVLTIICQSSVQSSVPPRVIVVLVDSREERNALLTGLRTMVSDIQMHAATVEMLKTPPPKTKSAGPSEATTPPNVGPKALSFKGPIRTPSKPAETPVAQEKPANVRLIMLITQLFACCIYI